MIPSERRECDGVTHLPRPELLDRPSWLLQRIFFSPDGSLILGGGSSVFWSGQEEYRTEWYLWDARRGRLLRRIQSGDHTDMTGFSVDGKTVRGFIYTDGAKGLNALWSTRTGKLLLKAKKKSSWDNLISPDDRAVLRFTDKSAAIYDLRNGTLQHTLYELDKNELAEKRSPMNARWSFSPDGKTLMERFALVDWKHPNVNLWDVATGKLKKSWLQPSPTSDHS